ncbi:MAG: hypothetical protein M3680_23620 [Myxococcota bacterium]|nr:hypothetical protein [Myxococcota bacterium]
MKLVVAVAVVLGALLAGCVVEDALRPELDRAAAHAVDVQQLERADSSEAAAVCTLAAALPVDDLCSMVCDPDAFAARLVDDGMATGNCYQFRCSLSADVTVTVGVCLP